MLDYLRDRSVECGLAARAGSSADGDGACRYWHRDSGCLLRIPDTPRERAHGHAGNCRGRDSVGPQWMMGFSFLEFLVPLQIFDYSGDFTFGQLVAKLRSNFDKPPGEISRTLKLREFVRWLAESVDCRWVALSASCDQRITCPRVPNHSACRSRSAAQGVIDRYFHVCLYRTRRCHSVRHKEDHACDRAD